MSVLLQAPSRAQAADSDWCDPGARDAAAARVTTSILPGASVLPITRFLDATVYPLVVWDRRALDLRLTTMVGPATTMESALHLVEIGAPSVLRVAGMVGVGASTPMRRALRPLRALARTIAMFPHYPSRSPLAAEEFDAQGTALVIAKAEDIVVHVPGDLGARPGSHLSALWRRVYEERLFEWAMRADAPVCGLELVEGLHPSVQ